MAALLTEKQAFSEQAFEQPVQPQNISAIITSAPSPSNEVLLLPTNAITTLPQSIPSNQPTMSPFAQNTLKPSISPTKEARSTQPPTEVSKT